MNVGGGGGVVISAQQAIFVKTPKDLLNKVGGIHTFLKILFLAYCFLHGVTLHGYKMCLFMGQGMMT